MAFPGNGDSLPDEFDPTVARVVAGNPTDEELGAVVAVLAAVFDAGRQADRPRDIPARRSGWERSRRAMRGAPGNDPFADTFGR
ncbi:acyl-CoA carboxylase epsilon subunit [Pseudoclavibacter endophyticus]|uniref:Acyl-CoA carboxylase subunit epsilon n=1 Tax=Pseudoclavibacter endophyticus TaxID=1778590 RepID=A0A6H9WCN2_9MICO|nr:acyl-CoA carboxylase epsilon subunit [Pseudoclavibacter endophyticus]KAB1648450.1 acyl-CoA carboxylase subunit epsilon [Pseudoclavibacter endophyticus]